MRIGYIDVWVMEILVENLGSPRILFLASFFALFDVVLVVAKTST